MARTLFSKKVLSAKAAADATGIGYAPADQVANLRETVVLVEFSAGTSVGTVLVEAARSNDYAGTWATIATIAWSAASSVKQANITGVHLALRLRISVAVVGGTVDGYITGTN